MTDAPEHFMDRLKVVDVSLRQGVEASQIAMLRILFPPGTEGIVGVHARLIKAPQLLAVFPLSRSPFRLLLYQEPVRILQSPESQYKLGQLWHSQRSCPSIKMLLMKHGGLQKSLTHSAIWYGWMGSHLWPELSRQVE